MPLQNYLHASRSLAKLASLGDIRESNANEHIVSKLLDIACNSDSTADQIYIAALGAIAPSNQMVSVQGGVLPKASQLAGMKVGDFQIGKYPVTLEEWQGVRKWAAENGFDMTEGSSAVVQSKRYVGGFKIDELEPIIEGDPVSEVNWYDCVKWCNAKSLMEGLEPMYGVKGLQGYYSKGEYEMNGASDVVIKPDGNGYRLPNEAEWEWAARGGRLTKGYTFAGSHTLVDVGWFDGNSGELVHPVGEKSCNELGIYDMSGNVQEWCWDAIDNFRVLRGGCANMHSALCALTFNLGAEEFKLGVALCRHGYNGFRIARSL